MKWNEIYENVQRMPASEIAGLYIKIVFPRSYPSFNKSGPLRVTSKIFVFLAILSGYLISTIANCSKSNERIYSLKRKTANAGTYWISTKELYMKLKVKNS